MTAGPARGAVAAFGLLAVFTFPLWTPNLYLLHVATLIAGYWVLIAGLNLVVGYAGALSIGHVGLLSIGAYAFAILAGTHGFDPLLTLLVSGALGAGSGFLLGLPSLRLPGFYFAMSTIALAMIVAEWSLALDGLTGGGTGLPVPGFRAPFDTPSGFYWLVVAISGVVTWMTWNVARFMWGRALISMRDSEVAAASVGVPIARMKLIVFTFSGFTAGVAGALFASLQSYITPETFVFELGLFFFVCIIIGGRGGILGPFLGTVVLTALPELVGPLAKLGNLFYGILLLVVVLLTPEGIGDLVRNAYERLRKRPPKKVPQPDLPRLSAAIARKKVG
jgi:branched-chain amino acid transport system permease protein